MGTKVKGLLKGLKSFSSQIFDDEKEKEEEIQIGAPTDVKHLAHIGSNGPANESPSWMKEFDPSTESQSGPLDKAKTMGREDSSDRKARRNGSNHRSSPSVETSADAQLLPRAGRNRRRSMDNNSFNSESQGKIRHTRRYQSEGRRRSHDQKTGDDVKTDLPKRPTRRRHKKTEESSIEGPTRSPTKSSADESDVV